MNTYAPVLKPLALTLIALAVLIAGCSPPQSLTLEEVNQFGSNPGNLRMYKYLARSPEGGLNTSERSETMKSSDSPAAGLALVVALHGCMQDATQYAESSGWARLADRWGFLLLLPEQKSRNHLTRCFHWYSPEDRQRDAGEALSILQMIDQMQRDHPVDPERVFVTGVSAGAAMSLNLLAAYPEIFAGGAPLAGIAFGCADGLFAGMGCMSDPPDKKAADWGAAVRSASTHAGPWPRLSVWQGDGDSAVNPANATAIVRQWVNVHGIDTAPEQEIDARGHVHNVYRGPDREPLVESHLIKEMGHGVPVDPGPGDSQCGREGTFFPDMDICSSLFIARFWGLGQGLAKNP